MLLQPGQQRLMGILTLDHTPGAASMSRPHRLLLVDDNSDDRALASVLLSRLPGVVVVEVADATDLVTELGAGEIAAVITEHRPGWADARRVLEAVKGRDGLCPVVLFTRDADPGLLSDAMRAGLDGYVIKDSAGFLRLPQVVSELVAAGAWGRGGPTRRLLDGLPTGIFTTGTEGVISGANAALARLLGATSARMVVGASLADLVADAVAAERLRQGEPLPAVDTRVRRLDGREITARLTAWEDAGGGLAGCLEDLAPVRVAESRLAARAEALQRSNSELEQFASVVSHDLQEPLHLVERFARLLAERYGSQVGEEGRTFLKHVVSGAERMQEMVDDALAYSRIGTRGRPFAPVDLEAAVATATANLEVSIEEAGATITHGELPAVLGDEGQIVQLLQNLVGNAIKFRSEQPPQVHVSAAPDGGGWVLSVRDNGIGIPVEHQERIFVMFQRLHTESEIPGTGIGLAICKRIAERHGGSIEVESEPGSGSVFRVWLPALPEDGTEPTETVEEES